MTNVLTLIKALNATTATRGEISKVKPRHQRRQEMRNAFRAAKLNQRKVG